MKKEYIATGVLGLKSPTGDIDTEEGTIVKDENFKAGSLLKEDIEKQLQSFLGEYLQVPHKYSATKFQGKALHEWAREGVEIEKDPVSRQIYEIELLEVNGEEVKFRVLVSSGTYIRVLFEDLAKKLGTFGLLKTLVRTKIGHHDIVDSIKDGSWPRSNEFGLEFVKDKARSVKELVSFQEISFDLETALRYQNGQTLKVDNNDGLYWVESEGLLYGLGEVRDKRLKSSINFSPAASAKIEDNY